MLGLGQNSIAHKMPRKIGDLARDPDAAFLGKLMNTKINEAIICWIQWMTDEASSS